MYLLWGGRSPLHHCMKNIKKNTNIQHFIKHKHNYYLIFVFLAVPLLRLSRVFFLSSLSGLVEARIWMVDITSANRLGRDFLCVVALECHSVTLVWSQVAKIVKRSLLSKASLWLRLLFEKRTSLKTLSHNQEPMHPVSSCHPVSQSGAEKSLQPIRSKEKSLQYI